MVRTQASLGSGLKRVTSDDFKTDSIILAEIIKVNYQEHTVQLKPLTSNVNGSSGGTFSAPYPKKFMGRTPEGVLFGQSPIMITGTIVLVGFVGGNMNTPIIISSYGSTVDNKRITSIPIESGNFRQEDTFKYGSVISSIYPSLNYSFSDGDGSIIHSFNGKSFLSITSIEDERPLATDFDTGTEYEDLYPSKYNDGTIIEPRQQIAPNILFKHQGTMTRNDEPDYHKTLFYIDEDGTVRMSVLDTALNKRTYSEMTRDGGTKTRYQNDSVLLEEGSQWVEYGIDPEKESFFISNRDHVFEFNDKGIVVDGIPMSENLEEGLGEAFKALDKIQESMKEIDNLLDGAGQENLREVISASNNAVINVSRLQSSFNALRDTTMTISERLEGAILKYDNYMKVVDEFIRTSSGIILGINTLTQTIQRDYTAQKNLVDSLKGRVELFESNLQSTVTNTVSNVVKNTIPGIISTEFNNYTTNTLDGIIQSKVNSSIETAINETINSSITSKVQELLKQEYTSSNTYVKMKDNFISSRSKLLFLQDTKKTEGRKPTIIISTDSIKASLGDAFNAIVTKVLNELNACTTEQDRINYLNTNLNTLENTDLKKILPADEIPLSVIYTDNVNRKSFLTTSSDIMYNSKLLPLDNMSDQTVDLSVISRFKICYTFNGKPIEELSVASTGMG